MTSKKEQKVIDQLIEGCEDVINGNVIYRVLPSKDGTDQSLTEAFPDSTLDPALAKNLIAPTKTSHSTITDEAAAIACAKKNKNDGPS